jgi:hypothetical protein
LNTKDLLPGIYSAVSKGFVTVTNVRESSEEHTYSMTVEHGHLDARLVTMWSKEAMDRSRGPQLTIIC